MAQARPIPCQHAIRTQCSGGQAASIVALHLAQGFAQVRLRHQAARKVSADDQVINLFNQLFHAGIEIVQIGNHRNAGGTGPASSLKRCGRIVTINVQQARIHNPLALQVARLQRNPPIAPAQHGAFAHAVHQNQRLRAGASRSGNDLRLDPRARKFLAMQQGRVVLAELSHVARPHAPVLASHYGRRHLAAGQHRCGTVFNLGTTFRKCRERDERVGGVQSNADQLHLRRFSHIFTINGR